MFRQHTNCKLRKMKTILITVALAICGITVQAQVPKKPVTNTTDIKSAGNKTTTGLPYINTNNEDSAIKERLVALAMENPALKAADANIEIAKIAEKKAKSSFLSSVTLGGNVNEFVVNNSEAANFFPKYNAGVLIPLDIFSRTKAEKKTAAQNLIINTQSKESQAREIRTAVLVLYENYKEKREILLLEKSSIEYDYSAYEAAQKSYSDGEILLEDMNKTHQTYLTEKSKLVSKEKDLNIAILQLEQVINVPLSEVIKL